MYVGFTGTRHGLTGVQASALCNWLRTHTVTFARHGCCIGADDEFGRMVHPHTPVHGHPSDLESFVSGRAVELCWEVFDPAPPLVRNVLIVELSDILLACPRTMRETYNSGTWHTVRAARKAGVPVVLFWPDGTVTNGSR